MGHLEGAKANELDTFLVFFDADGDGIEHCCESGLSLAFGRIVALTFVD